MKAYVIAVETPHDFALGFVSDAEAYIGAARQLQDFKGFGPRYFLFCHALDGTHIVYVLGKHGFFQRRPDFRNDEVPLHDVLGSSDKIEIGVPFLGNVVTAMT